MKFKKAGYIGAGLLAVFSLAGCEDASPEKALERCEHTVGQQLLCTHNGGLFSDGFLAGKSYTYWIDFDRGIVVERKDWHVIGPITGTESGNMGYERKAIADYPQEMQDKFEMLRQEHLVNKGMTPGTP